MEKETNRNMASAGTPRAVSSLSSLYEIPRAYNGLYIWNFSQLIILLKKLFLREGTRMSKEMRCLIERHYSCYNRIPIIRVPRSFPSLCRPMDFTPLYSHFYSVNSNYTNSSQTQTKSFSLMSLKFTPITTSVLVTPLGCH